MTAALLLTIALAGGLGATARFWLDGVLRARLASTLPWGTIIINLLGSLLLGLVTGLAASALVDHRWAQIVGTGFCGGFTTFSTASFETVRLAQQRRWAACLVNGLGVLIATTTLAALGFWIGSAG